MPARYRKVSKIADGGMAEIFLAIQHGAEGFKRRVVLKQILAALLADPKFRNNLVDEALVAMSLNHSNIVQVLDLGRSKERYFLVLELVDGWDLNGILTRVRDAHFSLPPELALYIVAEVCRALSYAHGQSRGEEPLGIVHRDVSPHNVLVSEQGEVKLTDFGIAKALGRRERTGQGIIKGKLAFMSPEQASGSHLDHRSDLFSVGTLLYLLVVGRRPFDSPTDLETILRVQQCQFPGPRQMKPDLPAAIADIVERSMQRDPAKRYQTGEEMLHDLEAAQRSVFRAAGQTELKRWLLELGGKDHALPTSRAAAETAEPMEEVDIDEDIVFEEVADQVAMGSARGQTSVSVIRAAEAFRVTPGDSPADSGREGSRESSTSSSSYRNPAALSFPTLPSRRRWLIGGLVGGAALTAGALVAARIRFGDLGQLADRLSGHEGNPTPPSGDPALGQFSPPPVPSPVPPPVPAQIPAIDVKTELAQAPAEPPPEPGSVAAIDPSDPSDRGEDPGSAGASQEEDEEALLERQEPDIAEKVIGEEPATAPPPTTRPRRTVAEPAPAPPATRRSSDAGSAKRPASVRIESRPDGAIIKLGNRVFGRAPMSLRFNPGITYELTFVKRGYESGRKRFTPSDRKGQRLAVSLRKRTVPKRKGSFLQRILGGLNRR
jgi:serine/threonine protein kinase